MTKSDKQAIAIGVGAIALLGLGFWGATSVVDEQRRAAEQRRKRGAELGAILAMLQRHLAEAARLRGVSPPPLVPWPGHNNAASDGTSVLVDLGWFEALFAHYCNNIVCQTAIALGVMAHELAHHLAGDATGARRPHTKELDADWWAGWTLRRAGITKDDFERVIVDLSTIEDVGHSHPSRDRRQAAIRDGYARGASGSVWSGVDIFS